MRFASKEARRVIELAPLSLTECPVCGAAFEPTDVVMIFAKAPEATRRQNADGFADLNGHTYVPGAAAKRAYLAAFGLP